MPHCNDVSVARSCNCTRVDRTAVAAASGRPSYADSYLRCRQRRCGFAAANRHCAMMLAFAHVAAAALCHPVWNHLSGTPAQFLLSRW
jgi:hypothetical protein